MVLRRHHFTTSLEVVGLNPFTLRVLLGTSSSRIEEVIYRLEGSAPLARHFLILVGQ